jgi:hypothetical protein
LAFLSLILLAAGAGLQFAAANDSSPVAADEAVADAAVADEATSDEADEKKADEPSAADAVDVFQAIDDGQAEVTFIARNDHAARVIVTNKTKQPLHLRMPAAFAGVPVLAQFGGGGGGQGGGGGGFGGGGGGQGGGQQSVGGGGGGGGFGGGGGGGQGGGGGGGFFSVPPEQTVKINLSTLCLDHGLRDPSSSKPYKMVPAVAHIDRPEVIELLQAFGRGELQHDAAQAAAWHLSSGVSWAELSAKLAGTARNAKRPPYFTADEIRAGMAYASEATRLAEVNAEEHRRAYAEHRAAKAQGEDSESRSTSEEL